MLAHLEPQGLMTMARFGASARELRETFAGLRRLRDQARKATDLSLPHLSMGMTGKMLTNYVGDGRLTKYGVRFTRQVWPGDALEATATVKGIREEGGKHYVDLTIETVNQKGEMVIAGEATALVDP